MTPRRSLIAWFFDTTDERVLEVLDRTGLMAPLARLANAIARLLQRFSRSGS